MGKARDWFFSALRSMGVLCGTLLGVYYLWKAELAELWKTLQHVQMSEVVQTLCAGAVIATVIYLLGKIRGWPHYHIYHWLHMGLDRLSERIKRSVGDDAELADDEDEDDDPQDEVFEPDDEDDEDDEVGYEPTALDRWAYQIDQWSQRALNLTFWVLACVFVSHFLSGEHTPLSLLGRLVIALWIVVFLMVPMRYVVGAALLAVWLDYIAVTAGDAQSAVQAALIGVGLVLWSFWERWRDKIRETPPEPNGPDAV